MTKPWSIRRRLTKGVLGQVILAWLVTILLALVFLNHETNEMLDEELEALAETVVQSLDASIGKVIPRMISIDPGNGERILRILPADQTAPDTPWPRLQEDGFHDVEGWRILRVTAEHAVIELAHNRAWRREEMFEAGSAFLVLILPLAGLLLLLVGRQLRKGFAPMEELAQSLSARAPADLEPIREAGLPQELRPMVAEMNQYLNRISDLRQSERSFIANASHELRTPLAAIRAGLEFSQDAEAQAALPRIDALTRRVERLLQLSRTESGLGLGSGPADLIQILTILQRDLKPSGGAPFHFDDGDFERFILSLDPDALAIVLRNLIENAQEHGTGAVWVRLTAEGVTISNHAASAEFWQAPFAKGAKSTGMGLGLSIVAQLCAALGVQIQVRHHEGQLMVSLTFAENSFVRPMRDAKAPTGH